MAGKPDFGAALRVLGSDLKDIAQHKREEQLMKLVREQREADMEAEREQRNRELGFQARQQQERDKAQAAQRAAEREQDWLRNSIPVPSGEVGGRLFPNMTRIPAGIYNALKPERPVRDPVADFKAEWDYRRDNPMPESGGGQVAKTPDMGGIFSDVSSFNPALAGALDNAGLLQALNAEAVRIAGEGKVQPQQAVMQAYQGIPDDPALVGEIASAFPEGLEAGGVVPEHKNSGFLGIKTTHDAQYIESILAASEDARLKLQAIGKKTKAISDEKLTAIVARSAAKFRLNKAGQDAVMQQILIGRAAENLPGAGGAPAASAEAELDRLQGVGGR